ncbi:MAG: C-GCAxxG-C-C family protein [Candidatus Cloacimonetes bacterium]|nr:C-GCAxxG-C-C family protein [Candidatus Cloacimonadota bacterium]
MTHRKVDKALATRAEGFNCAQAVVSSFTEETGIDEKTAKKISSCFGGGMRMGATCGALTGALMVLGLNKGFSQYSPERKADIELECINLISSWKAEIGSTDCKDILGIDVSDPEQRAQGKADGVFDKHCPACIETAVRLAISALQLV